MGEHYSNENYHCQDFISRGLWVSMFLLLCSRRLNVGQQGKEVISDYVVGNGGANWYITGFFLGQN